MGRFEPPGTVEIPGLRESNYAEFTIEWGVFIAEVNAALQGRPNVDFAYPYDCEIRAVAGNLTLGEGERQLGSETISTVGTYWFNLSADPAGIVDAAERLLDEESFPFLQRLSSRRAVVDTWLRGDLACCSSRVGFAAAIVLDGLGERAAARRLAADYLREAAVSYPAHHEFALERARAIGLV